MLTKISFTAEVWVAVHQDHMVKYSSFEGNMPANGNRPNWPKKKQEIPVGHLNKTGV